MTQNKELRVKANSPQLTRNSITSDLLPLCSPYSLPVATGAFVAAPSSRPVHWLFLIVKHCSPRQPLGSLLHLLQGFARITFSTKHSPPPHLSLQPLSSSPTLANPFPSTNHLKCHYYSLPCHSVPTPLARELPESRAFRCLL